MLMDARLIAYLNRAAGHETAAMQQYLAQARLCELWKEKEFGRQFEEDAKEELEHLGSLMQAMLSMGVTPQPSNLPAVRMGRTVNEILRIDRDLEIAAVRLYSEAAEYSLRRKDMIHHDLFRKIHDEEVEHLNTLERMIKQTGSARGFGE